MEPLGHFFWVQLLFREEVKEGNEETLAGKPQAAASGRRTPIHHPGSPLETEEERAKDTG